MINISNFRKILEEFDDNIESMLLKWIDNEISQDIINIVYDRIAIKYNETTGQARVAIKNEVYDLNHE